MLVIQAENRDINLLNRCMDNVASHAKNAGVEYHRDVLTTPSKLWKYAREPRSPKGAWTFHTFEAIRNRNHTADIVVSMDSDMVVSEGFFDELRRTIKASSKTIFFCPYHTPCNGGLIAVRPSLTLSSLLHSLPLPESHFARHPIIGEMETNEEQIFNDAVRWNTNGINEHIEFLPAWKFSAFPNAWYGSDMPWLESNSETLGEHFGMKFFYENTAYVEALLKRWMPE